MRCRCGCPAQLSVSLELLAPEAPLCVLECVRVGVGRGCPILPFGVVGRVGACLGAAPIVVYEVRGRLISDSGDVSAGRGRDDGKGVVMGAVGPCGGVSAWGV